MLQKSSKTNTAASNAPARGSHQRKALLEAFGGRFDCPETEELAAREETGARDETDSLDDEGVSPREEA